VIPAHIHVFGASGSGTTTLARTISSRYGHLHLDTDDFFWLPTDPPFQEKRPAEERLLLLKAALKKSPKWVLSGSLCGWGDPLIPEFDLAIFIAVEREVRMSRLRAREIERYGSEAIAPGGGMHRAHRAFIDWAASYEDGGLETRSRAVHEAWIENLPCPILRLEGDRSPDEQLMKVEEFARASAYGHLPSLGKANGD
jgi:adenylate kinase family enzyme